MIHAARVSPVRVRVFTSAYVQFIGPMFCHCGMGPIFYKLLPIYAFPS
jgi:hypothetical protein